MMKIQSFSPWAKKVKIDLADMDWKSWRTELQKDADVLELLTLMIADITPEHGSKLQKLFHLLDEKITNPINTGNKKHLFFLPSLIQQSICTIM